MLASYISDNHRHWDEHLARVGCAICSSRHEVTSFSPNFLVFGREIELRGTDNSSEEIPIQFAVWCLIDVLWILKNVPWRFPRCMKVVEAYERSKQNYNLRRQHMQYSPNQFAWHSNYVLSTHKYKLKDEQGSKGSEGTFPWWLTPAISGGFYAFVSLIRSTDASKIIQSLEFTADN